MANDYVNNKKTDIVNYRANRDRIKINELGSLYLDKDMQKDYRPTIYIGGQMEHRLHRLENATGRTFDSGHYMFDGSFMYEYFNHGTKSDINTLNFADNLVKSIEKAGIDEVDIITESYGGLIAACASKSKRIHKVIAIHPPILGTPLASNDVILDNLNKLERSQKLLAGAVTLVVNDYFGFEKENYLGINNSDILKSIDFNKLTVVGSALDRENDPSWLACSLYDIIYAITGEQSDGVVIYNEETLRKYGINYFTEIAQKNHFDAGSKKNLLRYAHKFLEGYKFVEDEEFDPNSYIDGSPTMPLMDKKFDLNNPKDKVESLRSNDKIAKSEVPCLTDDIYYYDDEDIAGLEDDLDIMSIDELDDIFGDPSASKHSLNPESKENRFSKALRFLKEDSKK